MSRIEGNVPRLRAKSVYFVGYLPDEWKINIRGKDCKLTIAFKVIDTKEVKAHAECILYSLTTLLRVLGIERSQTALLQGAIDVTQRIHKGLPATYAFT